MKLYYVSGPVSLAPHLVLEELRGFHSKPWKFPFDRGDLEKPELKRN